MTAIFNLNQSKKAAALILTASALLLITPVFAEDSTLDSTLGRPVQQRVNTRIEKIDTRIASKEARMKENMEERKAKMASRAAALKAKLQTFKDKKKAELAERVNTNLNRINQNQTDQMKKYLDKMSALLDKLEARVNKSAPDIKDPRATKDAIADARAAIAAALDAVQSQAAKDYTLQAASESTIKSAAQAQRQQLSQDLKSVRKQVIDARQKVADAIRIAKAGTRISTPSSKLKEGTISGQ